MDKDIKTRLKFSETILQAAVQSTPAKCTRSLFSWNFIVLSGNDDCVQLLI